MDFKSAASVATSPEQAPLISSFPQWYGRIRYWLNYALSEDTEISNNLCMQMVADQPFFSTRDYRDLMQTAIRHKIIRKAFEKPQHASQTRTEQLMGSTEEKSAQAKQEDAKYNRDLETWINKLDKVVAKLAPHISGQKSSFTANLELLSEVFELNPLEREILALLSSQRIAAFITQAASGDDHEDGYIKEMARCLGVVGGDSNKFQDENDQFDTTDETRIKQILFRTSNLKDAYLVKEIESYNTDFCVDGETLDMLAMKDLTKGIILAKTIGTLAEAELNFKEDCDYLDFGNEMVDAILGGLQRETTQGKIYFLVGPPGSGKSVLPAAVAAHIESIKQTKDDAFKLPVYVLGIDEDEGSSRDTHSRHNRNVFDIAGGDDEGNGKNNAQDRDVRRLLRARRMLRQMKIPAILAVEEADGILATLVSENGSAMTRAMRSQVLDHSPVITFLISNHPEKFDASANRRVIKYTMSVPPADKRKKMVLSMSEKFGLKVDPKDASSLSKEYIFTPGNIKSALQYLGDIVAGQRERGVERGSGVTLEELMIAFERKAVTMAGTSVQLSEKITVPQTIDPSLFLTEDLDAHHLKQLVDGEAPPRLWLFSGRPETEITELATYVASKSGDCEIIQIGSHDTELLEQFESAKRNAVPIVMTDFEIFLDHLRPDQLAKHPLLIAAQAHVDNGHSVFLISDNPPKDVLPPHRSIFMGPRRRFAGFNLAVGYDLETMIEKMTTIGPMPGTRAFFEQTSRTLTKKALKVDFLTDNPGIIIAGPKNIRAAFRVLKDSNETIDMGNMFRMLQLQGAVCTMDPDVIKRLTGLRPGTLPNLALN